MEYAANAYCAVMRRQGFAQSMNCPGQINDNAHMESFFHSLKSKCIHGERFDTDAQLRQTLRAYFAFYNHNHNHSRIHTSLSRVNPVSFELTNV